MSEQLLGSSRNSSSRRRGSGWATAVGAGPGSRAGPHCPRRPRGLVILTITSVSLVQSKAEEDTESGEDAGVSRRNSRLLMSSFSKRKVRAAPGLGASGLRLRCLDGPFWPGQCLSSDTWGCPELQGLGGAEWLGGKGLAAYVTARNAEGPAK